VDVDERVWEGDAWGAAIEACGREDREGGALVYEARYCSVCPDLAGYKCCAKSVTFSYGDGKEEEKEVEVEGCGLLLCEKCMELMGKGIAAGFDRGHESLDALVGEAARAKLIYPLGVRADAEFITMDGELMMRIGQGMGGDSEEEEVKSEVDKNEEMREEKRGKGKDMSFFSPPPVPKSASIDFKGKGGKMDMSYHTPTRSSTGIMAKQSPRVWIGDLKEGGWMNDEVVEKKVDTVSFGPEIKGAKAKGKSKWWDKEKTVWGEVEVIELSSGDES